jgi:hypothetical protein
VASLRSCVEPHHERVVLADGTELDLRRAEVRGAFAQRGTRGTASTLIAHCPSCRRVVRVLRKPYGAQQWGCRGCLPLIYPAQRRSGWHKGRAKRKPSTWKLAAIKEEQRRIARLLKLEHWPPEAITWDRSHLQATRRLQTERREALIDRLDALEHQRVHIYGLIFINRYGITIDKELKNHKDVAQQILNCTRWAVQENWRHPKSIRSLD